MPDVTNETESVDVEEYTMNKLYFGSFVIAVAYRDPQEFIDADGKNFLDSDGNQILVY